MRRCFYHTDLVQNAVFHNFSRQIAFIQYSGPSKQAWTFSETVQKISKITHLQFAKKFKRVTLQHDKEFIVFIDLLTKKRLSTSASDVHERLKTNGKEMKIALLRLLTMNKEI